MDVLPLPDPTHERPHPPRNSGRPARQPAALAHATEQWDRDIVKQLTDYIAIPAKSPGFDKDWVQHGHLETVVRNAAAWVEAQKVEGLTLEIVRLPGRTPVLFFEVAATRRGDARRPC